MLIEQKTVLFDMDGTIIDSRLTIEQAWVNAANAYGVTIHIEDIEEHIHGRSGQYTLEHFFGHLSEAEKAVVKKTVDDYEETADTPLIEGIIEFLEQLKANNIKMGLVTGSWRARIDHIFNLHHLSPYFSAVINRHDVTEGKPSPEGFKKCALLLNTEPEQCLVFEDSFSGFLAAEACGAPCISVGDNNVPLTSNVIGRISNFSSIDFEF
jgi:beta-phosphoglucomutase